MPHNKLVYYDYHARLKKRIAEGHLEGYKLVGEYHGNSPVLLLFFDDSPPRPVREYRWPEYLPLITAPPSKRD